MVTATSRLRVRNSYICTWQNSGLTNGCTAAPSQLSHIGEARGLRRNVPGFCRDQSGPVMIWWGLSPRVSPACLLITNNYKCLIVFGEQLSIGDGILLAALFRTQTGDVLALSMAYLLIDGILWDPPNLGCYLQNCMVHDS